MIIKNKPKSIIPFLKRKFKTLSYKTVTRQKLNFFFIGLFVISNLILWDFNVFDKNIKNFLNGSLGYVFFKSTNPFFSSWYLSIGNNGIGGDHSF